MEEKLKEAEKLIDALFDHLSYCGWGDSYEREGAKELMKTMDKYYARPENAARLTARG